MENSDEKRALDGACGAQRIVVCMGSSCFARGNNENLEAILRFLAEGGIEAEVQLTGSRCEERCAEGPVVTINGQRHGHLEPGRIEDMLRQHFAGRGEAGP